MMEFSLGKTSQEAKSRSTLIAFFRNLLSQSRAGMVSVVNTKIIECAVMTRAHCGKVSDP